MPEDEREEFAAEHDVEHMSARELDELIKQRDEAEQRAARAEEQVQQAAQQIHEHPLSAGEKALLQQRIQHILSTVGTNLN